MKFVKPITLIVTFLTVMSFMTVGAKNYVVPRAYMFGFVASFNDSTVYFTDIQEVDSVWLMSKKKMLAGRSNYSYQLRNYCADSLGLPNRTVIVVSSVKRKDVEKKLAKMKKEYLVKQAGKYDVHYINSSEFQFRSVNMDDSTN